MTDNNIEYWQKMAGFYTPFMKNNKKMYEAICREVEPILNRKMTVLELACGTGQLSFPLAPKTAHWEATDFSEQMIAEAKNAVEHAESEVKIGFYRYEMYAEITVQNDGEAINDEDKKHIFTRFYSGSGQPADSIGIGLSLAEAIVRHDNGYILVEDCTKDVLNEKNECSGTRFVVRYL